MGLAKPAVPTLPELKPSLFKPINMYVISVIAFLLLSIKTVIHFFLQYSKNEIDVKKLASFYILIPYKGREAEKKSALKHLANFCLYLFYFSLIIIIVKGIFLN